MIFKDNEVYAEGSEIHIEVATVLARIENSINRNLAFDKVAGSSMWLRLEDAEDLIVELHKAVRRVSISKEDNNEAKRYDGEFV